MPCTSCRHYSPEEPDSRVAGPGAPEGCQWVSSRIGLETTDRAGEAIAVAIEGILFKLAASDQCPLFESRYQR